MVFLVIIEVVQGTAGIMHIMNNHREPPCMWLTSLSFGGI